MFAVAGRADDGLLPPAGSITQVLFPRHNVGLNPDEITIAEVMKSQGYATACIGKWHLGHLPEFLPTRQGFDYYYGIPYSNDMDERFKAPPVPLMRGEDIIEQPADQATLTERYTAEAIDFIKRHKDEPFLVYLPHTMPHTPLFVSDRFKGRSKHGLYGDVVECIDWGVGEILSALKDEGLDDNTLVIFTSDNGPAGVGRRDAGSAGPLAKGKATTYEGGMRVPCVMRWPGHVPAGRDCNELATTMDLLSTAGYSKLGLPGDMLPGQDSSGVTLLNPSALNDFTNRELNLVFHADSPMLRGIRDYAPTALGNVDGCVIPARSDNDTANNPHNPLYALAMTGARGSVVDLIGSRSSDSGGNSMSPAMYIDPEFRPTKVDRPNDVTGLVDVGDLTTILGANDVTAVMESMARVSHKKLKLGTIDTGLNNDDIIKNLVRCGYLKAADLAERFGDTEVDPTLDLDILSIFSAAELNDREFSKDRVGDENGVERLRRGWLRHHGRLRLSHR